MRCIIALYFKIVLDLIQKESYNSYNEFFKGDTTMSKKRVGIMGGTFNPIHLGHLILAENAYEELELDEVLFVPSGNPYMKEYGDVLDAKTRIDLVGEAIEDNCHFALSRIEVDRGGNSYSYETIAALKAENPDTEYFFIQIK